MSTEPSAPPPDRDDTERSRRPWLHDLQIAVEGPVTCVALRDGDVDATVPGGAATGLFVDDRRVLHRLTARLDGRPAVPLAAASVGERTETLGVARHLGDPGSDPTVELARRRELNGDGLREVVEVRNRWVEAVSCRLDLLVAGDGADLADVRHGAVDARPRPSRASGSAVTWEDERHEVRVDAPGAVTTVGDGGAVLTWDLVVPAGGGVQVAIAVNARRLVPTEFDATAGADALGPQVARARAQDARLDRTVAVSLTDLAHLTMRDPEAPDDVFAAAGTPWYLTLFGRDALWAARMVLPFGTDLARGTLRSLARRQGTRHDVASAQEPGKIPHEIRRQTYGSAGHLVLPSRYYGTVDATALWVCLLHDAWRWGMAPTVVEELAPALRAALGWMERAVERAPDGLLRYEDASGTGLVNQGWKDSADAMRDAAGGVVSGPIALVEAQAYAVEAAHGAAALLEGVLDEDASRWRTWAAQLAGRVRDRFWVDAADGPLLAMALDGEGRPVDGLGSNIGHALGTGLLAPDEEELVATALTGPDLLGPLGISTLSRTNPGFNPIGYHTGSVWTHDTAICMLGLARSGRPDAAVAVARTLLDVAAASEYRWPELHGADPVLGRPVPYPLSCRPQAWSAASAAAIVSVLLGISADVPAGVLRLAPPRPAPFGATRIEGLRLGGSTVAVEVDATGLVSAVDGLDDGSVEVRLG